MRASYPRMLSCSTVPHARNTRFGHVPLYRLIIIDTESSHVIYVACLAPRLPLPKHASSTFIIITSASNERRVGTENLFCVPQRHRCRGLGTARNKVVRRRVARNCVAQQQRPPSRPSTNARPALCGVNVAHHRPHSPSVHF